MRLKLVPTVTNFDFFNRSKVWLGISGVFMVIALISFLLQGLNFGIDFRGGTTIRTESTTEINVGTYRDALAPLELGDIIISEVFDPSFDADQHVAMIRIQAQDGEEAVTAQMTKDAFAALSSVDPDDQICFSRKCWPQSFWRIDTNRDHCRHSGDCSGACFTSGYALNGNLRLALFWLWSMTCC